MRRSLFICYSDSSPWRVGRATPPSSWFDLSPWTVPADFCLALEQNSMFHGECDRSKTGDIPTQRILAETGVKSVDNNDGTGG